MKRRLRTVLCVLAGAAALGAPAAQAQQLPPAVKKVFEDFGRDGAISPCKHSVDELRATKRLIPPDIDQYAPDFPPAVNAALEAHARGECAGTTPQAAAPITGGGDPVATATPVPTAVPTKKVASEAPEPEGTPVALAAKRSRPAAPADVERVASAESSSSAPAPVWMLGGGAGLLGLAALGVVLAGRTRRGEQGLERFRHAWGETAWRASGTWSDFSDWLRAGR